VGSDEYYCGSCSASQQTLGSFRNVAGDESEAHYVHDCCDNHACQTCDGEEVEHGGPSCESARRMGTVECCDGDCGRHMIEVEEDDGCHTCTVEACRESTRPCDDEGASTASSWPSDEVATRVTVEGVLIGNTEATGSADGSNLLVQLSSLPF